MSKLQAVKPRGFRDRRARELIMAAGLAEKIGEIYRRYGFEPLETPFIEYSDALGKFLPDQDRPNEGVFSFRDDDEQWLSLRYDLTAPLARFYAENAQDLPLPFRSFRHGWVFRNEKSKPGRFRQFMQFDADSVGSASPAADAELCMMGADTLEYLGLRRGDYVIRVNNRKLTDAIMQRIGVEEQGRKLDIMRSMDKLDKIGLDGVAALLGKGRMDESGDFTAGAKLPGKAAQLILDFLSIEGCGGEETLARIEGLLGETALGREGLAELRQMQALFAAAGYGQERIKIDPSVVRGLEYYTGPVFEAELKMALVNKDGVTASIGSVGGGGRYDGLVARFSDAPVPATGFSIGLSRLMAALLHMNADGQPAQGPAVVLTMDRDLESMARYQAMVSALRRAGVSAELYLGAGGMKAQLKYADRRNAPCAVIQGSAERAKGEVQIKDLIEGARLSQSIDDNKEWRSGAAAQVSVKEADLAAAVKKVLARHKAG